MRRVHRETVDVLARFGRDGAFQRLPCHEGGIVVAGGSCRSAAPRPRALGRFVDTGWQDSRVVHDSRSSCSEKGPSLARSARDAFPKGDLRGFSDTRRAYLAKASSFRIHGARILPGRGVFPVPGPFWDTWSAKLAKDCRPGTHRGKILPRMAARERIAREYCHGWPPMDAPRRNIAAVGRRGRNSRASCHRRALRNAPRHDLAAIGRSRRTPHAPRPTAPVRSTAPNAPPLVPCHSAMYRNVMHCSATDARAERPAPRLPLGPRRRTPPRPMFPRARRSFPAPLRPPRHYGAMRRTQRFCRR